MSIILPNKFARQPQYFPRIDKGGVGGDLRFALVGGMRREIYNSIASAGTVGTQRAMPAGIAYMPGTTATTWTKEVPGLDPFLGPMTVNWYGYLRTNVQGILLNSLGSSFGWYFYLQANATNTVRPTMYGLNSANIQSAIVSCEDDTLHSLSARILRGGSPTVEFFFDGVSIGAPAAWTGDIGAVGANQTFGMYDDSGGTAPQRMISCQAYTGMLNNSQIMALHQRPWSWLKGPNQQFFVDAGGASGTTYIITPTGGIVFGGAAPTAKGKVFQVSGGISFAGTNPIVGVRNYTITPSGGIVFSGSAPITFGNSTTYVITPTGGITFSGSATVIKSHIQIPSGGIVFGGSAPLTSNTVVSTITSRLPLTGAGK